MPVDSEDHNEGLLLEPFLTEQVCTMGRRRYPNLERSLSGQDFLADMLGNCVE